MHGQQHGGTISEAYQDHRAYLVDLAFRMLGDIGAAEDIVQDAFTRLMAANLGEIEDQRGWLIVVTSRLCLDQIKSAAPAGSAPTTPARSSSSGRPPAKPWPIRPTGSHSTTESGSRCSSCCSSSARPSGSPSCCTTSSRCRSTPSPRQWAAVLQLTFRAVAERAGVGERSVYRHFPTKRLLHDAVVQRLEEEADITYETFALANLADVTTRGVRRRRLLRGPGKRQRAGQSDVRGRRRAPAGGVAARRLDVDPALVRRPARDRGSAPRRPVEPAVLRAAGRRLEPQQSERDQRDHVAYQQGVAGDR